MSFEIVHLVKRVELDAETDPSGESAAFTLATDVPGGSLAAVLEANFQTAGTRQVVKFVLAGTARARHIQATVAPGAAGVCRLFGGRVLAKALGQPGDKTWTWYPLPVRETEETYQAGAVPIRPTPEGYAEAPLPIRPTPAVYSEAPLPIRPTPQEYSMAPLPLPPLAPTPKWLNLPLDQLYYNYQERPQANL